MAIPQTVGERIAQRREALGLTQDALGKRVGVSRVTVTRWEGDAGIAGAREKGPALAAALGVSEEWIFYGVGNGHDAGDVAGALTGARQEGYEAGYADGRRAGLEEAASAMDATTAALRRRTSGGQAGADPAARRAPLPAVSAAELEDVRRRADAEAAAGAVIPAADAPPPNAAPPMGTSPHRRRRSSNG